MFEHIAESRIRAAIKDGEFDNLPGRGAPLDLDWYFALPPELRMAYALLKSSNAAPPEVDLMAEIASLQRRLDSDDRPEVRVVLTKQLADLRLKLAMLLEREPRPRSQRERDTAGSQRMRSFAL